MQFDLFNECNFIVSVFKDIIRGFFPISPTVSVRVDIDSKINNKSNFVEFMENGDTLVNWQIDDSDRDRVYLYAQQLTDIFKDEDVKYFAEELKASNIANTYHPTGLHAEYMEESDPYNLRTDPNIKVFSTGILPGAFSSNPTASILALVEKFIDEI